MSTKCPEKPAAVPLYYAAKLGFRDLAEHLISKHPEYVNARGGYENTPMHIAAFAGHADVLSLLLDHGADVDGRGGSLLHTPLHRAAYEGNLEAGQCLINHNAEINAQSSLNWTPLHCAANYKQVEFIRMLLECGARTDVQTSSRGETPLHEAVGRNCIEAVRLLLEHGADVNSRDNYGRTPSQIAKKQDIVELLSKYGTESVASMV